jgi:Putative MetA-pathway of phenol degradation
MPRTPRSATRLLAALMICSSATPSVAEDDSAEGCDKSQYTLFNPTPRACMREFEPDHPDQTSNPFTIDAGHIEPETTLFSYLRSSRDNEGAVTDRFMFGSTDIRVGLLNNFEIGVDVSPYNIVGTHFEGAAADKWVSGPDAVGLETKLNLYGNDSFEKPGSTSLAILTDVEIPTRNGVSEDAVEGSVAFPFAIKFSKANELELMTKYDFIKNKEGAGYHVEFFNSGSFSHNWTPKFSTYFEVATRFGNEDPSGGIVDIGIGAAYQPDDNTQIDCGMNIGLSEAADPINPFFGVIKRF